MKGIMLIIYEFRCKKRKCFIYFFNFTFRTDEQAPIPGVFDALVERLHGLDSETDVIFNCQLGRGRTTTVHTIYFDRINVV